MTEEADRSKVEKLLREPNDRYKRLRTIGLVVTRKCNLTCPFCIWNKQECDKEVFMDLNILKKALEEGKKYKYNCVQITGGEPILHPKFREIIEMIVDYGFDFTIVSNAMLWERYKFIVEDSRIKEKFNSIAFSLDGSKELHDSGRATGSYDKVLEAIKFFKDKKGVSIKMALGIHNCPQEILNVLKIAYDSGVEAELFSITDIKEFCLTGLHIEAIYKLLETNKELISNYVNKIPIAVSLLKNIDKIDYCPAFISREIEILPEGKVCFCCVKDYPEFIIGDLNQEGFAEILNRRLTLSRKLLNGIMDFMLNPNIINTTVQDGCSICKNILNCEKYGKEVIHNYNNEPTL